MDKNINNNQNNFQEKKNILDKKIQDMRISVLDSEKCKEIAQKLTAYIANDKK